MVIREIVTITGNSTSDRSCISRFGRATLCLLTILLVHWLTISPASATFKDTEWSVRGSGMAGAYATMSEDGLGALHNPAGLANLAERELGLMYAKPYMGLNLQAGQEGETSLGLTALSLASPFRFGTLAFNWARFDVSGVYGENTYSFTYARTIKRSPLSFIEDMQWGGNLKFLSRSFTLDSRTQATEATSAASPFNGGTSKSALSLDLGMKATAWDRVALGLVGRNLNSPDLGLKESDPVPRDYRIGAGWLQGDIGSFEDLTPTMEISYRKPDGNDADLRVHFGVESWFLFHTYGARIGFNNREIAFGGSWNRDFTAVSLQLDYAFSWSTTIGDNAGTHRLLLSLRQRARTPTGETFKKFDDFYNKPISLEDIDSETPEGSEPEAPKGEVPK